MNQLITIQGVRGYIDDKGTAQLHLEDLARGLGFIQRKKEYEYVRWERVHGYLADMGFPQLVGKDFVPENVFYRLSMKGESEAAISFQSKVADEILPAIRRTGTYSVPTLTPNQAMAVALQQTAEMMTRVPELESKIETVERKLDKQITLFSGEQRRLQQAINQRVCIIEPIKSERAELFRQLHRDIKNRWAVASYKDVLRQDLQGVIRYVDAWVPIKKF
ncbi:hypothetical protein BVG16_13385 [Paenibacillus selenitireducens]|uniref:ORF6C domain-containing protein n=1 Tax=Paenibacillus selenitireducens TaxID=1324314 RepID=A0A1T2XCN0_9BACL|nr:ORF6C domain-containing protein [Paenibacillus selenitireducens]OPA77446.1 hypothetical protein BVG16_13385 [Paenibacillus selenitireducens]